MKITFLGTGGAFSRIKENYQNNSIIEMADGYSLLIDCGTTALESLSKLEGYKEAPHKIDGVLVTHIHADHVGGLEELAFRNYFLEDKRKIDLFISPALLPMRSGEVGDGTDLWENCLKGGLQHIQDAESNPLKATLDTYFNVIMSNEFHIRGSSFILFKTEHVSGKASFGFYITETKDENKPKMSLFSADSKRLDPTLYEVADLIFHDCAFFPKYPSTVHTHFEELCELPLEVRKKIKIMHYGDPKNQPDDLCNMDLVKAHQSYML